MKLTSDLIRAILDSVARIGLDATAIMLERMNKPDATLDDARAACRAAQSKTLQDFINEDKAKNP